jgi:large subunit ribosomal protein L10
MRSELRKNGVKFEVIKNTVLRRVFADLGFEGLDDVFKGPTAVGYSDDIIAPAKVLAKFSEDFEPMEIKGGIIDGKVASVNEVMALAKVPDPTTLQTQVAYSLLFPFTKLAMLVKAVAEKKQEEGGEAAPAAAPVAVAEAPAAEAPAAEEAAPAETPAE